MVGGSHCLWMKGVIDEYLTQSILANVSLNLLETHEWLVGHQLVLNDWLGRMSIRDLGVINTISYLYHLLNESKNISYEEEEEIGMYRRCELLLNPKKQVQG